MKSMMDGFEVVKYLSPVPLVILCKFSRTFEYIFKVNHCKSFILAKYCVAG